MSFVPICVTRRPGARAASVAVRSRHGFEYADLRLSPGLCSSAGFRRFDYVAPFADLGALHLKLCSSDKSNPAARALGCEGGQQLVVRWPRIGPFAALVPRAKQRIAVPVVSAEPGSIVLSFRNLNPSPR